MTTVWFTVLPLILASTLHHFNRLALYYLLQISKVVDTALALTSISLVSRPSDFWRAWYAMPRGR
jgi:hypothetical protein